MVTEAERRAIRLWWESIEHDLRERGYTNIRSVSFTLFNEERSFYRSKRDRRPPALWQIDRLAGVLQTTRAALWERWDAYDRQERAGEPATFWTAYRNPRAEDIIAEEFWERVAELAKRYLHLSQRQFSFYCGKYGHWISKQKTRQANPMPETVRLLAKKLDLPIAEVVRPPAFSDTFPSPRKNSVHIYQKQYHQKNKKRLLEKRREYSRTHKEQEAARSRAYYEQYRARLAPRAIENRKKRKEKEFQKMQKTVDKAKKQG